MNRLKALFAAFLAVGCLVGVLHAQTIVPGGGSGGGGSGTVTSVSVTTQNGVSASVTNPTATPALAFTLGAITPSSAAIGAGSAVTSSGPGGALTSAAYTAIGTSGATIPLLNAINTWAAVQTFTAAPVFTDASGTRTALGLAAVAASGSASDLSTGTLPCAPMGNSGFGRGKLIGANLNTTADQAITVCLPTGSTNYKLLTGGIVISNPSISMTTAVCGVWTGASKSGTTVVGSGANGVTMAGLTNNTAGSSGSATAPTINNSASAFYVATTLFFACSTAQGATATADVSIAAQLLN